MVGLVFVKFVLERFELGRIGSFQTDRLIVVRFESVAYAVNIIVKIDDKRAFLARNFAVEPGKRLHRLHIVQVRVSIHGA